MLFININPTRYTWSRHPAFSWIFLSLFRDAAALWHSSMSSDLMTRLHYPGAGAGGSLGPTTALSCHSPPLWPHPLHSWDYSRGQGIGSTQKAGTGMDEAGGHESSLKGALVWLGPSPCASLIGWRGRPEIAEAVHTVEFVQLKCSAAYSHFPVPCITRGCYQDQMRWCR